MNDLLASPRNREIAGLLLQGCSDHEIAADLGIAPHTVKQHLRIIYARAGIVSGRKRVRLLAILSADAERADLPALTQTERRIAALAIEGLTNPEIAARCEMSLQVVKNQMISVFDKCGVWTRTELAAQFRCA